jgi:hypothetical protein
LRHAILPSALIAGGASIIFVREFLGDLPVWLEAPFVILCMLLILTALALLVVQLKRNLKDTWQLEDKSDK